MDKKPVIFSLVLLALLLFGCVSEQGTIIEYGTDSLKEIKIIKKNGLTYEKVNFIVNREKENTNKFIKGDKLTLSFEGVEGFVLDNGRVFLGFIITVIDAQGNEIMRKDDLMAGYDETGVSPDKAKRISVDLGMVPPLESGETYIWKSKIWDKRGRGEINTEVEVKVVETDSSMKMAISEKDLTLKEAYILADGIRTGGNEAEMMIGKRIIAYFEGIDFVLDNGKAFPGASTAVIDAQGNEIMRKDDLMAGYDETGVSPENANLLWPFLDVGSPLESGQTYTWEIRIWDKKGEGEINTEVAVRVK